MRKRRFWLWMPVAALFAVPCLFAGIGLLIGRHAYAKVADTLPAAVVAAKAQGMPTNAAELRATLALAPDDNAAGLYRSAFAALIVPTYGYKVVDPMAAVSDGTANADQERQFKLVLKQNSTALDFAERASAKPGVDWERRWEDGWMITFPELAKMKSLVKILCAEAISGAKEGRTDISFHRLSVAERIAWHAGSEPSMISAFVQDALDGVILKTAWIILCRKQDEHTIEAARVFLRYLPPLPDFAKAFSGEMVMSRSNVQNITKIVRDLSITDSPVFSDDPSVLILIRDPVFRKAMEAHVLHYWVGVAETARDHRDWPSFKSQGERLAQQNEADHSTVAKAAYLFEPSFAESATGEARCQAMRNILACAIDVLAQRSRTGTLPSALPTQGVQAMDPFTLRSLKYKLVPDGFKIYSVDADLVDDGGLTRAEDKHSKSQTHDLSETFPLQNRAGTPR